MGDFYVYNVPFQSRLIININRIKYSSNDRFEGSSSLHQLRGWGHHVMVNDGSSPGVPIDEVKQHLLRDGFSNALHHT